jgi:hypothetical protein
MIHKSRQIWTGKLKICCNGHSSFTCASRVVALEGLATGYKSEPCCSDATTVVGDSQMQFSVSLPKSAVALSKSSEHENRGVNLVAAFSASRPDGWFV